jgi:hypothetical protein
MAKTDTEIAATGKKEVSAETRAKLSEAMKARWARERVQRAERADRLTEVEESSLIKLYRAAYELTGDHDGLKAAVAGCCTAETLVHALEAETSAGTNLQHNIRRVLRAKIADAIGANAEE